MKSIRSAISMVIVFALSGLVAAADGPADGRPYEKDPAAIAILEQADAAVRALPGISYQATYFGTHTSRGRLSADVLLQREDTLDDTMGTIAYKVRSEVIVTDPPYGQAPLPDRYTLLDGTDGAKLADPANGTLHVAAGMSRYALNIGGVGTVIPPQYVRVDPFKMEIEDSIGARYLGTELVDGISTDVLWLKFADTSGFGEQLLYFGSKDHLLRKVTFTAPRVVIRERTESTPEATYPTVHFDLTLTGLSVMQEIDEARFSVPREGYREVDFDDRPLVGNPGPQWTLRTAAGGTISSADLRGQVTYIFFWASWCPNCHTYMPEVQRIHDEFGDVRVISVNAFDRDDAMQYIRELGYTFEVALDGDELLVQQFRFIGQPALVVLDREGVIRHRELVPRMDQAAEVRELIYELLRESS